MWQLWWWEKGPNYHRSEGDKERDGKGIGAVDEATNGRIPVLLVKRRDDVLMPKARRKSSRKPPFNDPFGPSRASGDPRLSALRGPPCFCLSIYSSGP